MSHDQQAKPAAQTDTPRGKATALFNAAFQCPRDPRSPEYKRGVLYILLFKCGAIKRAPNPYPAGTAQSDAWSAGTYEGHNIWNQSLGQPGREQEQ
jgi:hypothetical protein